MANPQVEETLQVLDDWMALKRERPQDRLGPSSRRRVGSVLSFLGLPFENERQLKGQSGSPSNSRWVHLMFEGDPTRIDGIKGAPQFGSRANGEYHIFCFWEDARSDLIRIDRGVRLLGRGTQSAVIVLFLGVLTEEERQDIRRRACLEDVSIAILDEMLLGFLGRSEGNRFQKLLAVTLPYTPANPYNPVTSGWGARVPHEMFYGREELADSIITMRGGTSLVFGGRQLGKTALLRYVENTFPQTGMKRFAWFIDLKDRGYVSVLEQGNGKDPAEIFRIIYEHFQSTGILRNGALDGSVEQIRLEILDAFKNDPQLQVLAMFDESDAFLHSDSARGSMAVESIRSLMDSTDNRFKAVFAGLHNVQRFARTPNNPFPNLGFDSNRPRRGGIGPLHYQDARRLIEQPFGLLGFRFQELAVDKILSYTNRHPSLIQFFCHELIQTYRDNNPDKTPPFTIGIEDVDRVYRTQSIQDGIKMRFEETFKLDPRYHVISLTMILFQDRPTQKWSLEQIREHCEACCPITFRSETFEYIELKSLLDELVGLGVLAEDDGSYRMRSSLIPQMFGSNSEIERTLDELAEIV